MKLVFMFICEYCGSEHNGSYGSGRFCNISCSHKYAASKRTEQNAGYKFTKEGIAKGNYNSKITHIKRGKIYRYNWLLGVISGKINPYHGGYSRFRDRLIEFGCKQRVCDICGNTKWNGEDIPLEVHHIDGNHDNNKLSNIQFLCPNCHASTPNFRWKKKNNN